MKKAANNKYAAAILAGGKSLRYNGKNKALLNVGQEIILDSIVKVLNAVFSKIIIISNKSEDFSLFPFDVYQDIYMDIGPLGGIHSALKNLETDAVFIVSCDMPFLNKEIVCELIDFYENNHFDIVIPQIEIRIEPLHAIYSNSILRSLELYLNTTKEYKIRNFFPMVATGFLNLESNDKNRKVFTNINSPDDLIKLVF